MAWAKRPRPSSRAIAVAAVAACSLCVMAIVFTAGRPADSAELLFKTPKLKDLLGTFMKSQGASAKDINEMDKYYKGAAKKGRAQMLDDISSEFDPITDADSNYGRVIGVKVASRTNPAIAEDMDVSGERKARVQMLDDISSEFDPITDADSNYGRVIGVKVASRTNPAIAEDMDVSGERKARVQMLDDISSEFDPISDADSNYGRVIGVKVASRTNPAIAEDMDVSGERKARVQMLYDLDGPQPTDPTYAALRKSAVRYKARGPSKQMKLRQMIEQGIIGTADKAPVQMLAERTGPVNVWAQIGAEEPSQAAQQVMRQNDDTGYKARVQMLDDISSEFDPITDADSNYGRVIGVKVASRTNPAIAEDMDVSGERKARVQMLDDISSEFDPITDADSNYGRVIGVKVASRTNPAIAEDMDVSGERKARVQMLYDIDGPQPTDAKYASWKQAAKYDQGMKKGNTLKAQILAGQPH